LCSKYGAKEIPEQQQCDLVIETVGRKQSQTFDTAIRHSRIGGVVLILGVYPEGYTLDFNARSAFYKELSIIGVNSFIACEERDDFADALALISRNEDLFEGLITHELSLENFSEGIDLMNDKANSGAIKIVFRP